MILYDRDYVMYIGGMSHLGQCSVSVLAAAGTHTAELLSFYSHSHDYNTTAINLNDICIQQITYQVIYLYNQFILLTVIKSLVSSLYEIIQTA